MRLRRSRRGDDLPLVCLRLVELVTDYLEGALDPALRRRVAEHLAACDACTAYVAQVRAILVLTRDLPPEPVPPAMIESLTAAFRARRGDA